MHNPASIALALSLTLAACGGGSGGNGAPHCATPATDCPVPATACVQAVCGAGGECGTVNAASGSSCADHGGQVCDGSGACVGCLGPADCPATGTVCSVATCASHACGVTHAALGTACADHGGVVCDGAGSCIAACGDGIVEVGLGEQCDRGSANGTGGCSASCQLSAGSYLNETEPNDSEATGNDLGGHLGAVGALAPAGDVDWYLVHVTVAGSSITAEIGDGFGGCPSGFDSRLSLYSGSGTLLATDTAGGVSPCSKIAPQIVPAAANLPIGEYALKVERVSGQAQADYVLTAGVAAPGCGDGVIQNGEQCDPGPTPVAGCSATCQLTGDFISETEPNDTQGLANPLGAHAGFIGSIAPAGDQDFFSFAVPGPASSVAIQTSDGIGGCPVGFDSLLTLFDPAGVALVQDDNGGVAGCSQISATLYPQAASLPAGTYRVRVQFTGNQNTQKQYVVTISVQ